MTEGQGEGRSALGGQMDLPRATTQGLILTGIRTPIRTLTRNGTRTLTHNPNPESERKPDP